MDYRFVQDGIEDNSQATILAVMDRLDQHRAGLIVGPHGSGKTTLLHSLGPWLNERFAETANMQLFAPPSPGILDRLAHARQTAQQVRRRHDLLGDGGLLIVDGAEQLWRHDLARLLRRVHRRGQTVLATSHLPLPRMTILHETKVSRNLVVSLADSLLEGVSADLAEIVHRELRKQDWSRLTNVRDLWFELYEVVQPQITPTLYPSSRNNRDGHSIVRHHGSLCTPDGGGRADGRRDCR